MEVLLFGMMKIIKYYYKLILQISYVYFDIYNEPSLADVCINNELLFNCIQQFYVIYGEGYDGLYLHDGLGTYGAQEAGDNSYRFSGANPNNYV